MMDKTELLFRMMEHPEQYDDQQWRGILSDKECRELYDTMSLTQSAIDAERLDLRTDETAIQEEWEQFAAAHPAEAASRRSWRRMVAAAAIAAVFFGIVVAAVHTRLFGLGNSDAPVVEHTQQPASSSSPATRASEDQEITNVLKEPRLYDNVALEQIIDYMAAWYDVEVEWQSDTVRSLRLYYQWEPDYTLDKVVDMLNSFQAFTIKHTHGKLIISDIANEQ